MSTEVEIILIKLAILGKVEATGAQSLAEHAKNTLKYVC